MERTRRVSRLRDGNSLSINKIIKGKKEARSQLENNKKAKNITRNDGPEDDFLYYLGDLQGGRLLACPFELRCLSAGWFLVSFLRL